MFVRAQLPFRTAVRYAVGSVLNQTYVYKLKTVLKCSKNPTQVSGLRFFLGIKLTHMMAILRHLGRKHGLTATNGEDDSAQCDFDMISEQVRDLAGASIDFMYFPDLRAKVYEVGFFTSVGTTKGQKPNKVVVVVLFLWGKLENFYFLLQFSILALVFTAEILRTHDKEVK